MTKPSPTKKKGVVVDPLNWVSPEMREELAQKDHDKVATRDASSSSGKSE
ncbi:MAG: hypothetical protein L0H54_03090 [Alcaligenaceae bacterium]|nr:hypothetical protein [Alcaligenaceae bacterium]